MTKRKNKELDVDHIGGSGPLTKEEEQKISEYIRAQKKRSVPKKAHKKQVSETRSAA